MFCILYIALDTSDILVQFWVVTSISLDLSRNVVRISNGHSKRAPRYDLGLSHVNMHKVGRNLLVLISLMAQKCWEHPGTLIHTQSVACYCQTVCNHTIQVLLRHAHFCRLFVLYEFLAKCHWSCRLFIWPQRCKSSNSTNCSSRMFVK